MWKSTHMLHFKSYVLRNMLKFTNLQVKNLKMRIIILLFLVYFHIQFQHILSIPLTAGRGTGAETCGLTFVPLEEVYIQECRSVLVKLHPITFYRTVFVGRARFLGWMPLFVFFGLPIVSCSMINSLILGCLWPLVFVLNNILILGIWRSAIFYLPRCFCPWTFFQYIGFNMVPSDPLMSHLATQLGYSAGEFQALQLIVLAAVGVVDWSLASGMLVHLSGIDF